jgi:hypothetical protein
MTSSPRPFRAVAAGALALGLSAAALTVVPTAQAAWTPSATAIPEGAPGEEVESDRRLGGELAVARDGTAWFAWVQDAMSTVPSLQRVLISKRPAGGEWQAPEVVGTITRTNATFPTDNDVELAVDAAGRPTVAWNELTGTVSPTTPQTVLVHTRSVGADGQWGTTTDFAALPMTLLPLEAPLTLQVTPDGTAALAWQTTDGLYLARRATTTWTTPEQVESYAVAKVPDVVGLGFDRTERLTLVWRSWDATASAWDVKTRSHTGSAWAGDAVTLQEDAPTAARSGLVVDAAGGAVAIWGTDDGARAAVRPTGSTTFAAPKSLSTGTANAVADPTTSATYRTTGGMGVPSAAYDAYGTATVVWPEVDPTPRIATAEVGRDGTWGATSTIAAEGDASNINPPSAPRVAVGRDGQAAVTYVRKVGTVGGISGGQIVVTERAAGATTWSTPEVYTTPSNGAFSTVSALGLNNSANVALFGDATGDVTLAWTPYASHAAAGIQPNRVIDRPGLATTGLEWSARGVTGSSNVRSWLNYLRTDWAGVGEACPKGLHEVQTSDGASMPGGEDESWRFTQVGASKDASGRTIVQYDGELRWVMEAHCIDIRLRDPRLEIAADGLSARLYASGLTSGSMSEAMEGNASKTPFANLRVLEIDLAGAGPRPTGATDTWLSAPVTLASAAASTLGLDLYSEQPFGHLTISVPDTLGLAPAMTVTGPETRTYGKAATVTVSVPNATGSVTLSGIGADQTATLANGTATFPLPADLPAGAHLATASYAGDGTYAPRWASYALSVEKAEPAVSLDLPEAVAGTPTDISVEIPGATGSVTVTGAGEPLEADLVDGVAELTLPALAEGSHELTATYAGDANHEDGAGTGTLVVGPAPIASTTTLTLARASSSYGAPTTATVVVAAPDETPTGPVTITVGGRTVARTLAAGRASVRLPANVVPGRYTVTASYAGVGLVASSSDTATLTVAKAKPKLTLKLVKKQVRKSQRASVKVTLALPGVSLAPTAKVVVKARGKTLVTRTVAAGRTVTLKLPRLARGSYRLKASSDATPLLGGAATAVQVLKVR